MELLRLGMAAVLAYLVVLNLPEVRERDLPCPRFVRHLEVLSGRRRTVPEVDRGCTAVLEEQSRHMPDLAIGMEGFLEGLRVAVLEDETGLSGRSCQTRQSAR